MKLLDTTFLIHYWAGQKSVEDYLETREEEEFVTTTLNIKRDRRWGDDSREPRSL